MNRSLKLFQVYYRLHSDGVLRYRFCLSFSRCHSVQVLIRSLASDGVDLNGFDYVRSDFIVSYR